MNRVLFFACLLLPGARAEVLDRIAIVVGRNVITELQIDEELRVTAFLNNKPLARDSAVRRAASRQLIEQLLVEREMNLSHYPPPDPAEIDKYVAQVRAALADYKDFDAALQQYALTPGILRQHLQLQLAMLQFIEFRFRPDPGNASSETLAEHRTDEALDTWLEESRKQANIVFLDRSLQ
jgi:hypothetical protein